MKKIVFSTLVAALTFASAPAFADGTEKIRYNGMCDGAFCVDPTILKLQCPMCPVINPLANMGDPIDRATTIDRAIINDSVLTNTQTQTAR